MHLKKIIPTAKAYAIRTLSVSSLALIIISGLTVGLPVSSASAATLTSSGTTLDYGFGLTVGESMLGLSSATLNKELDDIVSLHVGQLRFDINWNSVQQYSSSRFDWSRIDAFVAAANAHHMALLAVIVDTPAWARSSQCSYTDQCPPADPAAFATFVKAAVARYSPLGLIKWEIWNEPNLTGAWASGANAAAYTALLKAAYTAIKSVQPWGGVITGGLAPAANTNSSIAPVTFLTQMYADGAKNYFNAVGFHPYSFPADPTNYQVWNAWSQMSQTPSNLRAVMTANGDGPKRIWITEFGAPTGGPGNMATAGMISNFSGAPDHVTEALQSEIIAQAIPLVRSWSWAGPLFLYSYKDLGTSQSTNENFFGLIRYDGSTKPAYNTLKTLLQ